MSALGIRSMYMKAAAEIISSTSARILIFCASYNLWLYIHGTFLDFFGQQFLQLLSMNKEFGLVLGAGSRIDVMPWLKVI